MLYLRQKQANNYESYLISGFNAFASNSASSSYSGSASLAAPATVSYGSSAPSQSFPQPTIPSYGSGVGDNNCPVERSLSDTGNCQQGGQVC